MTTDAERFTAWLNGTPEPTRKVSKRKQSNTVKVTVRKPTPNGVKVMIRADAKAIGMVSAMTPGGKGNSKRTGYVGLRTYSREHTSDITVTLPSGDVYTIKQARRRSTTRTASIKNENIMQATRIDHTKVGAATQAPLGDSNH